MAKVKSTTTGLVKTPAFWFVLIMWSLAFEWLHSGWGKFSEPGYMAAIGKILAGFAAKTPFGFYSDFLKANAIPHAWAFGNLVRFSELLIGLGLVVGGLALIVRYRLLLMRPILAAALLGGALLNLNFYWAAGWSSPSTSGINVVMGLVQLMLAGAVITKAV